MNKKENNLEIITSKKLGNIRVPRLLAQGNYRIPDKHKIKIVNKNGGVSYRNPTTIVDEKIADTCIQIFQSSNIAKQMEYKILREKAEEELEERFIKYKLIPNESIYSKSEVIEIKKKREIAIHQWIREYIENNLDLKFYVDFDEFVALTGIKSATRIGYALNMLKDIQQKASHEYKIPKINEDFSVINYEFNYVAAIPTIGIELDEEMGSKYKTLDDFIKADIKNKKKHIKSITFEINKSYISAVLGLGRDYTETNRKQRDMFKTTYAFKLDILIKSIASVQGYEKFNRFTFEELKDKLGSNITEYRLFKKNVLIPALNDLNNFTDYHIELIETRHSKKIDYVSFNIISKDKKNANLKYGRDKRAYYIASRLYYFSPQNKILNLLAYANNIEKQIEDGTLTLYDNKYFKDWEEEANREFKIEEELIKFMEDNKRLFETKNIIYDDKRMCLVEKTLVFKDTYLTVNPDNPDEKIDKEGKQEEKIKLIKTRDYTVNSPSASLKYIHEVLLKELPQESSIIDFIPFYITSSRGLIEINDIETYIKNKQMIQFHILEKNLSYFKFDEDSLVKDIFYTKILQGEFREITAEFREMVKQLHTYNIKYNLPA